MNRKENLIHKVSPKRKKTIKTTTPTAAVAAKVDPLLSKYSLWQSSEQKPTRTQRRTYVFVKLSYLWLKSACVLVCCELSQITKFIS